MADNQKDQQATGTKRQGDPAENRHEGRENQHITDADHNPEIGLDLVEEHEAEFAGDDTEDPTRAGQEVWSPSSPPPST